jgi:hypothetical protein
MENIRKATRKDKAAIVGVLAQAFWNEPLINYRMERCISPMILRLWQYGEMILPQSFRFI